MVVFSTLIKVFSEKKIKTILVEGGGTVNWEFIKQKDVYKIYNETLIDLCEENKWDLWDVEMLLFAKAEELVLKISKSSQYGTADWSPLRN